MTEDFADLLAVVVTGSLLWLLGLAALTGGWGW